MVTTLTDIKKHPNFAGVFKFYVLGYAHFFNTDSNFCNRRSIAVNPFSSKFILTPELRTAINDAMTNMNKEIQRAVADMNDATFGYVSITEGFAGHRFCEPGQEKDWPYTTNRAWFWSANVLATASDDPNDPQQQQIDDDFLKAYNNTDSTEAAAYLSKFDWTYLDLTADGLNATSGPDQNGAPGSTLRPMHPTIEGHGAITDILIARVQQDFGADALSN